MDARQLIAAANDVLDSADNAGCSDDLTVVSQSSVDALQKAVDDADANLEYTQAHMENAMMVIEHIMVKANRFATGWLEQIGGSAGMREYVANVSRELERQVTAIGIRWDEDCDWYDLCERMATAITLHPTETPAQLVRDVLNAECRIVSRPEPATAAANEAGADDDCDVCHGSAEYTGEHCPACGRNVPDIEGIDDGTIVNE